jgi:uncharacterized membrane protein
MSMRVHELHAAVIHAPLAILPTAAAVDLTAAITRARGYDRLGRTLWWVGAGSGLFAGLTGMAASQEVRTGDQRTTDMVWLHGIGNFVLVVGAFGIATWRSARRPSVLQASLGLAACAASLYTAYLGGEMVYGRGVGVKAMPDYTRGGVEQSPPLLSARAPLTFVRDAIAGLKWLFTRGRDAIAGREPLSRGAFIGGEVEHPRAEAETPI